MAEPWDSLKNTFPDNTTGLITALTMRDQVDVLEGEDANNVKSADLAASMQPILEGLFVPFWKGVWIAGEYTKGDLVTDGGWLMIANKTTSDRPAPQPIGDPETNYPTTPTWDTPTPGHVGQVWTGCRVVFSQAGWLKEALVFLPEVSDNISYLFGIVNDTDPDNRVVHYLPVGALTAGSWNVISIGSEAISEGADLVFIISAINSATSTTVTGNWNYDGMDNAFNPNTGGWNVNNASTTLRIDKADNLAADRTADLATFVAGSTVTFTGVGNPSEFRTYRLNSDPTDEGTAFTWGVTVVNGSASMTLGDSALEASVPQLTVPTQYVETAGYYPGAEQPSFGTVSGYKAFDGVAQSGVENYAYGFGLTFQSASVSDDWDVLASSETGGQATYTPTYDYAKVTGYVVPSTTYTEVNRLTTVERSPGTYELKLSWTSTCDSTINPQSFRWSTDGGSTWNEYVIEAKDTADVYPFAYGFPLEWDGGVLEVIFQAKKGGAGDNMIIDYHDIIFERKP